MIRWTFAAAFALVAAAVPAQEGQRAPVPVYEMPRWHSVTDPSASDTNPLIVRSLRTGQPLGGLGPGARFLAFGQDDKIVTLALNGEIGYIPAGTSSPLFPVVRPERPWRYPGKTLEEMRAEQQQQMQQNRSRGLYPEKTPEPAPGTTMPGGPGGRVDGGREGAV